MGVHTGDSITIAPAQTLSDKEYQRMRTGSIDILREVGVDCGGSNVRITSYNVCYTKLLRHTIMALSFLSRITSISYSFQPINDSSTSAVPTGDSAIARFMTCDNCLLYRRTFV